MNNAPDMAPSRGGDADADTKKKVMVMDLLSDTESTQGASTISGGKSYSEMQQAKEARKMKEGGTPGAVRVSNGVDLEANLFIQSLESEKSAIELEALAVEDDQENNERVKAENEELRKKLQNVAIAVAETSPDESKKDDDVSVVPIYKRPWFWCIAIVILGSLGVGLWFALMRKDAPSVGGIQEFPMIENTESPTPMIENSESPTPGPTTLAPTSQRHADLAEILADFAPFEGHKQEAFDWIVNQDTWTPRDDTFDPIAVWKERFVLAVFFYSLDGPNWPVRYGFLGDDHHCFWNGEYESGVSCHLPGADQIKMLRFSSNSELVGTLPSELSSLEQLKVLDIFQNALSGTLPNWLGSMSQLTELTLCMSRD